MARSPGAQGRSDAINTLEGVALYAKKIAVHVRTAEVDGRIFIDLGDDSRDAVDVGPEGWRIVQRPPVRFVRPRGLLPLPRPVAGGRIDDLRPLTRRSPTYSRARSLATSTQMPRAITGTPEWRGG